MGIKSSRSPKETSKLLSYSTMDLKEPETFVDPTSKSSSQSLPTMRTQSRKTRDDPAEPFVDTIRLQKSFIQTLPFRTASNRLVKQWLSNWFGHHVDCPILDKAHAAALEKVTWDGWSVRRYTKETLYVDLIAWGFLEGDATGLVEDIVEARGFWNRISRSMRLYLPIMVFGQLIFLAKLFVQIFMTVDWFPAPLLFVDALKQWVFITTGLVVFHLFLNSTYQTIWRWNFWRLQKKHIREIHDRWV